MRDRSLSTRAACSTTTTVADDDTGNSLGAKPEFSAGNADVAINVVILLDLAVARDSNAGP
jgi:hypothetical protein